MAFSVVYHSTIIHSNLVMSVNNNDYYYNNYNNNNNNYGSVLESHYE